jgi:diketogulonate reductase-like aldo/keto reductase
MMDTVPANGASIPAIGLGTWTLKGADCARLVADAIRLGYRHIDTAAMYDNEAAVGEGIRASGVARDEIFLTTKVWHTEIGPGRLERSVEASLKRLGDRQADLVLIHWPNRDIPLHQSIAALNTVKAAGLTRHIGVANFTTALLAEAVRASESPLACNQIEHHPYLDQSKVRAACADAGMAVVAYCPLARGGDLFAESPVAAAATRHGRTPAQIVLRWQVQRGGTAAIPRTTRVERLAENIAIFDFQLADEEMAAITALGRKNSRICDYGFSPDWDRP